MKKEVSMFIFVLLLVSSINIVIAEDTTTLAGVQDAEDIQNLVGQIPVTDDGNIDPDKLANYTSKAEQRIAEINKFLDKVSWLKYVFGIPPAISILFLINILIIIVFLVYIKNILEFSTFSNNVTTTITILFTIVLIQVNTISSISRKLISMFTSWWFYAILIVGLIVIAKLGSFMGNYAEARRKNKAERKVEKMSKHSEEVEKGAMDAKIVSAFADGVEEGLGVKKR